MVAHTLEQKTDKTRLSLSPKVLFKPFTISNGQPHHKFPEIALKESFLIPA
jgi:hypothetical protein